MRTIHTFILRLLVDPAEPETLRGALEPVPEGKTRPFGDEQVLLDVLHDLVARPDRPAAGFGPVDPAHG